MDINVIAENLAELLTNTVNLTDVYYDLFINPTPMDITLKQYNSNNELIEVTIPNRAKDRQISLSGEGSPEGVIEAPLGTFYVDIQNNLVYIKKTLSGSNGWQLILTPEDLDLILDDYVLKSTTINGKSLSTNITLTPSDIGALPDDTFIPTITDIYSAESHDGMSGIAVAEAVGEVENKLDTAVEEINTKFEQTEEHINSEAKFPCSLNSGNIDSSGNADLIDATLSQDTEYSAAGTYTFEIQTAGYYPIALVGGGGGAWSGLNVYGYGSYCGGGSGAAFVGEVYLNVGTHQIVVGAIDNTYNVGNSILYDENGNALITAGGGTKGAGTNYNLERAGGYGGALTIVDGVQTQNVTVQSNGLDGGFGNGNNPQSGGASVYGGYGTGANSPADNNSTSGYFSIILPSASSNISYKVGGSYPALTGTLADGKQFTLNGLNSDDITGLADGTYIKYVDSDGSSDLLKSNLTVAKTIPLLPSDNDVWVNNSVSPLSVKKYVDPNYTVVGSPTITSDGIASGFSDSTTITSAPSAITSLTSSSILEFEMRVDIPSSLPSSVSTIMTIGTSNREGGSIDLTHTGKLRVLGNARGATLATGATYDVQPNTSYICYGKVDFSDTDGTHTGSIYGEIRSLDGTVLNSNKSYGGEFGGTWYGMTYTNYNGFISIGTLNVSGNMYPSQIPIDMKTIKVWVDGTLVFNPVFPNGWQDYNKVPVGKITLSSGGITGVKTLPYNIDYVSSGLGYSMPSNRYIDLTLGADGTTYTAPANGWFCIWGITTNIDNYIGFESSSLNIVHSCESNDNESAIIPVKKGDIVTVNYDYINIRGFRFVYSCDSQGEY